MTLVDKYRNGAQVPELEAESGTDVEQHGKAGRPETDVTGPDSAVAKLPHFPPVRNDNTSTGKPSRSNESPNGFPNGSR